MYMYIMYITNGIDVAIVRNSLHFSVCLFIFDQVILAAELLKHAEDLIKYKIHPTSIIQGYRMACKLVTLALNTPCYIMYVYSVHLYLHAYYMYTLVSLLKGFLSYESNLCENCQFNCVIFPLVHL